MILAPDHCLFFYFTSNKERTHDAIGTFFKRIVLTIRRREVVLWHLFCLRVNLIIKKNTFVLPLSVVRLPSCDLL